MAIDVRVTDTNITARSERVLFVCDRASLRCSVQSTDGSRQLAGFRPRALLGSRGLEPLTLEGHRVDPVETALGDATALTLCFATRGPLTLELCVELGDEWPGLVLELAARNSGERTVRVDALEPVSWRRRHGEIAVPGAADGLHFFRMGYQSWSPAGYSRLGERERRSRLPLIRTIHYGPFTPPARRGWFDPPNID